MLVSLCVVAFNEERVIEELFEDIRKQSFPHNKIQIILVDGNSSDKTKEMMEDFSQNNDFISVEIIDNPKQKQASGWNLAISNAKGDVIIRIDAHATIPYDFIQKNIDVLKSGEDISGGKRPNILVNPTKWGQTLLMAESSMFGSSFAPYRKSEKKQYVNSMFHAAYRKEIFNKVGLFNEHLGRTEDNELHYRMRQAGYKFCYSPEIVSYQHVRSSFKQMIKQKFLNGYWIGLTLGICPGCLALYHFAPLVFFLLISTFALIALKNTSFLFFLLLVYFTFSFVMSGISIVNIKRFNLSMLILPLLFFLLHFCYGIGTFIGLLAYPFKRKKLLD